MSILFSRQCEYAIQALLYLALKGDGEMTSIKELTKKLDVPFHFIAKILQHLVNKKILSSLTGPTGGFTLRIPPEKITLLEIIKIFDGESVLQNCVLGFTDCSNKNPCALHMQWSTMKDELYITLKNKSIYQLANETYKPAFEILHK